MGRMKKNMAEFRKEMLKLEARSNSQFIAASSNAAQKEEPRRNDLQKTGTDKLPFWLQKILPLIAFLLMLILSLCHDEPALKVV